MQTPNPPFWFKQRQGTMEAAGEQLYRLTAPNSAEAFIGVRPVEHARWQPIVRMKTDGPDLAPASLGLDTPQEAWEAAFELYRQKVVV